MATRSYGEKRKSGDMMYGPGPSIPQWPDFKIGTCIRKGDFTPVLKDKNGNVLKDSEGNPIRRSRT